MSLNTPGTNRHDAHRQIARHLERVNIAPPEGVQRALDLDAALRTVTAADPLETLRAGIAGTMTATEAGKQATKAATAMVVADRAAQVHQAVQPDLDRLARRALADDADRILEELQPALDRAVAAIREALAAFGSLDAPSKDALRVPALAATYEQSVTARQQVRHVEDVRSDLAECGYGTPTSDASWWITDATQLDGAPSRLEHIIAQGYAVRVNTAEQSADIARLRDAEAARLAEERAERKRQATERDPFVRTLRRAQERITQQAAAQQGGPRDAA